MRDDTKNVSTQDAIEMTLHRWRVRTMTSLTLANDIASIFEFSVQTKKFYKTNKHCDFKQLSRGRCQKDK